MSLPELLHPAKNNNTIDITAAGDSAKKIRPKLTTNWEHSLIFKIGLNDFGHLAVKRAEIRR